jgi:NitT/TauT family transport system ATP-binding protein
MQHVANLSELRAAQSDDVAIKVDSLSHVYAGPDGGVPALVDISMSVRKGRFVVIVGPSGCGKTSLLMMLAGLRQQTEGKILCHGRPMAEPDPLRVGVIFQEASLFPWLSTLDNIEFPLSLRGTPREERRRRSQAMLRLVGLEGFGERYPHELSGGMKQRVAIARTLINRPKIVLMDEPFGALDPQTRWGMQSLLLDVSRTEDNTILFVTHDVSEAVYLADTIYILSSRPARVLHKVDVPYFAVRDVALKSAPEFRAVEKRLLDLLYSPPDSGVA